MEVTQFTRGTIKNIRDNTINILRMFVCPSCNDDITVYDLEREKCGCGEWYFSDKNNKFILDES